MTRRRRGGGHARHAQTGAAFVLAIGSLASASASAQDASARERLDPAGVAQAIIAADNAMDLGAVMDLYASDAELWPPGESPVRGAGAIEARYRQIFATVRPHMRTEIERVREADGWALIEGKVHGTVVPAAGGDPQTVDDKYLMVLERSSSGVWRITRLMWSPNRSP